MPAIEHTPTPWKADSLGYLETASGEPVPIASPWREGVYDCGDPTAIANAAFIVCACNSHDSLVGVVKRMIDFAHSGGAFMYPPGSLQELVHAYRAATVAG